MTDILRQEKIDMLSWQEKERKSINKIFENEIDSHHLKYSIDLSLKQFWPFWKFEQILKSRIIEGNTFSYNEIRNFNLFKSSDASLIYARVLDAKLPTLVKMFR